MRAIRFIRHGVKKLTATLVKSRVAISSPTNFIKDFSVDADAGASFVCLPEFAPFPVASCNQWTNLSANSSTFSFLNTISTFAFDNKVTFRNSIVFSFIRRITSTLSYCAILMCLTFNPDTAQAANDSGEFGSAIDFTMYKLAVESNDASAQYLVGRNFLKGKTVTKNVKEAIKWFKLAAEQNHQLAQYSLGRIYFFGDDVKRNTTLGMEYIVKAANNGLDEAQLFLGNYYLGNNGGKLDMELAKKWLLSASEFNNPRAQYQLGKILLEGGNDSDNDKAVKWLRAASDAGLLEASKLLKRIRTDGKGLNSVAVFQNEDANQMALASDSVDNKANETLSKPDLPSEEKISKNSAADKAAVAESNTKTSSDNKEKPSDNSAAKSDPQSNAVAKVKVDSSIAMPVTNKAMSSSSLFANAKLSDSEEKMPPSKQFNLAMEYINGEHGVKKDLSRGIALLLAAAHRDNPRAQYTYGLMLRDGAGVEKDVNSALTWLNKASTAGLASAKREYENLKLQTMRKSGVNNPDKPAAQYSLGLRLLKGDGIKQNEVEAADWILKAAKQNYHEAEARIGSMYRQGIGVEKNERLAMRWLEKAAGAGVLSAARELKALEDETNKSRLAKLESAGDKIDDSVTADSAKPIQKTAFKQKFFPAEDGADGILLDNFPSQESQVKTPTKSEKDTESGQSNKDVNNGGSAAGKNRKPAKTNNDNLQGDAKVAMSENQAKSSDILEIDKDSNLYPLMRLAKNGDKGAQYEFAVKLLQENKTSQALEEAIKWLTLAADNQHLAAQLKLAGMYQSGSQVKRDLKKAYDLYLQAANFGNDDAQLKLGDMYRNGEGVDADNSEAILWYRKSANQGNQEARHRLGGCKIC